MPVARLVKPLMVTVLLAALGACAQPEGREGFAAADPYEGANRFFHENNVRLDRFVLRPAALTYDYVTPTLFKHMIGNGLSHIDLPRGFANNLLQGEGEAALDTLGRFTINTLLGAGGLLDPAREFGLRKEATDFGITLGKYGVGEGFYLVLPLLGPSTVRDAGGFVVDKAFDPMTYVGIYTAAEGAGPAVTLTGIIDQRDRRGDFIDQVLYESVDSYVTLRSAYLQRRRSQIAGGETTEESLPDLFDDEETSQ